MRHMGKMGLSEKFENIESNAEKGVWDIWEKWGWRELKKMSNEILGYGEKGVCEIWKKGA